MLKTDTIHKEEESLKNDLIAKLNHELRTPLTTIKLYIQMVARSALKGGDQQTLSLLSIANEQADCMTKMIDNFLSLSVLENGRISLYTTLFRVRELLEQLSCVKHSDYAEHHLVIDCPEQFYLNADQDKIVQVLHNYVSNAVKYSPQGSTIRIACKKTPQEIIFSVSDTGMGISTADQTQLFSKFFRSECEMVRKIKGFGIGLYLVKEIVEQHRGRVWVNSVAGAGSTFYFSLPATGIYEAGRIGNCL